MFLKTLELHNYGVFDHAKFNLATDVDHPLVLITGNNGAGKTSMLEALRVALHGRRAFDTPVGEAEYLRKMLGKFHNHDHTAPCSVLLEFDYVDQHATRTVSVNRSWAMRRQHVVESLTVLVDGAERPAEDADDLLSTILPPEIARYFFFDGERIREMAEWGVEDEAALFQAVSDLLGLGVLDQLKNDLTRLMGQESKLERTGEDLTARLDEAHAAVERSTTALRTVRTQSRRLRGSVDRARAAVHRLGALQSSERSAAQERLGALGAERKSLHDEFERAAHDILPLLCARTLRDRFLKDLEVRFRIEEREIVTEFLDKNAPEIKNSLKAANVKLTDIATVLSALESVARGKPMAVTPAFPHITRSDATWMHRVIERELPELSARMVDVSTRLIEIEKELKYTEDRLRSAPSGDPAAEKALDDLEACQRAVVEHEVSVASLEQQLAVETAIVESLEQNARLHRQEAFRSGRLAVKGRAMHNVLDALPTLTARLQDSKEQRFAMHLKAALNDLWHKDGRLTDVRVSFAERRIDLFQGKTLLEKADLSAGEKQLFAIGFIYALAQLSGSRLPLIIDTPLGRLDRDHRRRFVAGFLPTASHQVVLLSTDTEIVGSLFEDIESLLAHHYELSEYNGGVTNPVMVALG